MEQITILDTAKAILENPDEVLLSSSLNFEQHQANLKMLAHLGVVPIVENEFLFEKSRIRYFVENNGKTEEQIISEKSLKISEKANKIAIISLVIAIVSIFISLKH
ncbi:hypothetical protein A2U13_08800 [Fusobacterium necrophorum subsp. funduliforme]|uniref:hypothetical protein n=1 Tax=Fusobacterium necrophorum TaxID=859 RepID=UPI00078755EC|nr:hypothetical protein [Fusobacterium necrophorum]KYM67115.1 hypothetical protein A2U13_08800 [Fusobacterium necrophorum subsp. funduliforme]